MRSKNTPMLDTRCVPNSFWAVAIWAYTRRLSTSGMPVLKMPCTTTSIAFNAPSVVLASSVRLLPGLALRLRAKPSPSITDTSPGLPPNTSPALMVRKGPLTANSASGSTPSPSMTTDLSPLLIKPLN